MKKTKETGIIRNFDDLGRVVIPKEFRKKLRFENNGPVEMLIVGEGVLLRKPIDSCVQCGGAISGNADELNLNYCDSCISELKEKLALISL